jgi:hypothetical protein
MWTLGIKKMSCPYIQSLIVSFPACMVYGETKYLRAYFKSQNLGQYFRYGDTALISIEIANFNYTSLWELIRQLFLILQNQHIISLELTVQLLKIHEIKLRFDIPIPGAIFCRTSGFRKINENIYCSNEYHQNIRRKEFYSESKGIQRSFITVINYDWGSSVILSFSGRYREHVSMDFLLLGYNAFTERLVAFGSVYLTQATRPNDFRISRGYVPFLPDSFHSLLNNANWFNNDFRRKNMTTNFIGGLYNDI